MGRKSQWIVVLIVGCACFTWGCANNPYRFSNFHPKADPEDGTSKEIVFEYGRPNKTLDRMAWFVCLPTRILPMSANVNDHKFSPLTREKLTAYMQENDLSDVLVRVNQYDPAGEWRRLRENTRIGAGWRYTFGVAGWLGYVLLPYRVFGGDVYNAYTNSLYVNSDVPSLLIVEAAYAKDIHQRRFPGTYAAINEMPVLTLWRHTLAVNDTLGYARLNDDWEVERETYRVVYPLLGIHIALGGHSAVSMTTAMPMITVPITAIGGAIAGHTFGQSTIARRERQRDTERANMNPDDEELDRYLESRDAFESGIELTNGVEPLLKAGHSTAVDSAEFSTIVPMDKIK